MDALRDIRRRLVGLAARAVIRVADDALKAQGLKIEVLAGETLEGVERFGEFGITSVPPDGTEGVVIFIGGDRSHGVVVATESRAHRPRSLAAGDVTVYDSHGNQIRLRAGGIEIMSAGYIRLGAGATEAAVLGGVFVAAYNGHTHSTPAGPSGVPVPLVLPAAVLSPTVTVDGP